MESIFIEIDQNVFQTYSNIVIGLIYRMPDTSVDIFNEGITDISNVIDREKKIIYLIGDPNIDLFKCESHQPTSIALYILYSNNVFSSDYKANKSNWKYSHINRSHFKQ